MKHYKTKTLLATLTLMLATACVPLKQYQKLSEEHSVLKYNHGDVKKENDRLKVENNELKADKERLQKKLDALKDENDKLATENQKLKYRIDDLQTNYQDAISEIDAGTLDDDNTKLLHYLQKLQEDLQKREDELIAAEKELKKREEALTLAQEHLANKERDLLAATDELASKERDLLATMEQLNITEGQLVDAETQLSDQRKRLLELEDALKKKDEAMLALKQKVSDALSNFSSDDLNVHMKNGLVYVSMEEKLLFQSGRYDVNAQGVEALKKVASVLEQNKDVDLIVEGHTDKVPFKGSVIQDNWDLSVKRATSVVRIILESANIEPKRVSAQGRAEYLPLIDEDNKEAYSKNRRTEIILTPQLDKLLNLLELNNTEK